MICLWFPPTSCLTVVGHSSVLFCRLVFHPLFLVLFCSTQLSSRFRCFPSCPCVCSCLLDRLHLFFISPTCLHFPHHFLYLYQPTSFVPCWFVSVHCWFLSLLACLHFTISNFVIKFHFFEIHILNKIFGVWTHSFNLIFSLLFGAAVLVEVTTNSKVSKVES